MTAFYCNVVNKTLIGKKKEQQLVLSEYNFILLLETLINNLDQNAIPKYRFGINLKLIVREGERGGKV